MSPPAILTVEPGAGELLISEFRTRGPGGAADEFVEVYNPTTTTIPIGGLKIRVSNGSGSISDRVTITAGTVLGPGCHYLVANGSASGYTGTVPADQTYGTGITDDGGGGDNGFQWHEHYRPGGMSAGSAYKEGATLRRLQRTSIRVTKESLEVCSATVRIPGTMQAILDRPLRAIHKTLPPAVLIQARRTFRLPKQTRLIR
jgi:hypothetical protein